MVFVYHITAIYSLHIAHGKGYSRLFVLFLQVVYAEKPTSRKQFSQLLFGEVGVGEENIAHLL